jgi:hypothetical protein
MAAGDETPDAVEAKERKPFLLRLQPELLEELRAWAGQDLRSLNAHIEFLLREAVKKRRGGKGT